MNLAKRIYATRELTLLRATKPDPPMVSSLDLVDEALNCEVTAREGAAAQREARLEYFIPQDHNIPITSWGED